jgi:hypothetical protein
MVGGGADKIATEQNSFQSRHKFPGGSGFYNVTLSAGAEGSAHYLRGRVLTEEQYADSRSHIQDLLSDPDPTDVREPNIEHHEVRVKFRHLLESSQPISGLTNHLNLGCGSKSGRDKVHPGRVIVHNKDTNIR